MRLEPVGLALARRRAFSFESWALGPYSWMYGYGAGLENNSRPPCLAFRRPAVLAVGAIRWRRWTATRSGRYADPLNWETLFVALFQPWLANGLHRFVQYFIAIYFTSLLCRKQLGLGAWHALLGGVFFACFSYFTFGEMLALPALPLFLLLMQFSRESPRGAWLPLAIGLGFSTFTTFVHSVPYFAVFAALWSTVVLRDVSIRSATNLGLIVVGLTIGDLPQLLALLANAATSHREGIPPEIVPWSIDGLFYRQLRFDYFNHDVVLQPIAWQYPLPTLTFGAALLGIVQFRGREPAAIASMYLRVYAVYLLLSQRWLFVSAQNVLGEWIPSVRGIFIGRFFDVPASLLIACQLALLVAAVCTWVEKSKWALIPIHLGIAAFVGLMLIQPKIFLFYRIGVDGWGEMDYRIKALEDLQKAETEPFRVASVLPLQPGYAYAQGLETVDGWANLYPKVYREYWLKVLAPLFASVPGAKQIFDPDSGKPQDHYIFLGADLTSPTVGALPGEDASQALKEGFDVERRFDLKLLGLLNVKYLLSELPLKGRGIELVHSPAEPSGVARSRDWARVAPPTRSPSSTDAARWRRSGMPLPIYGKRAGSRQSERTYTSIVSTTLCRVSGLSRSSDSSRTAAACCRALPLYRRGTCAELPWQSAQTIRAPASVSTPAVRFASLASVRMNCESRSGQRQVHCSRSE